MTEELSEREEAMLRGIVGKRPLSGIVEHAALICVAREAYLAGKQAQQWISAQDQPPVNQVLLVSDTDKRVHMAELDQSNADCPWYLLDEDGRVPIGRITHWQPLPAAPVEKEDER